MRTYSPSLLQRIVLGVSGIIAGVIAWRGIVEPVAFLESFNVGVADAAARNEIIGQYGGFFAAVCVFLFAGVIGWARTSSALMLLVCLYGGVLAGRLIALFQDGWAVFADYPPLLQFAHGMDGLGFLASIAALKTRPDRVSGAPRASKRDHDP